MADKQTSLLPDPRKVEIEARAEIDAELFRAAVDKRKAELRAPKLGWFTRLCRALNGYHTSRNQRK